MLELLILYTLFERDLTTYGVRKNIVDDFGIYFSPSLGAVHPAIVRLVKKGFILESKNISEGGQKSCYHHLTTEGKNYFTKLFLDDFSETPAKAAFEIKIKVAMLNKISDKDNLETFVQSTKQKVDMLMFDVQNFIGDKNPEKEKNIISSAEIFLAELVVLKNAVAKLQAESGK